MKVSQLTNWLLGALIAVILALSGWLVSAWNTTTAAIQHRQELIEQVVSENNLRLERVDTRQEDVLRRLESFEVKLDAWYLSKQ